MSRKELGPGARKPRRAPAALLLPLSASALALSALLFGATAPAGRRASAQLWSNSAAPPRPASARTRGVKKTAAHGGVSFTYDAWLASEVKALTVPASVPAPDEVAFPLDAAYPEHVAFGLVGTYPHEPASFIKPEVRVYPVADFRKTFAPFAGVNAEVERNLKRLRQLLKTRPRDFAGVPPFLPELTPHTLALRARTHYVRFRGGWGLACVLQAQQEEMPVNNQNLSYEFQGLTDDGRFYVTARFPVAAPFLANDRDDARYDGFEHPGCFDCPAERAFRRRYRAYAARVARRLERLPAAGFTPSLGMYDELLSSIEIRK